MNFTENGPPQSLALGATAACGPGDASDATVQTAPRNASLGSTVSSGNVCGGGVTYAPATYFTGVDCFAHKIGVFGSRGGGSNVFHSLAVIMFVGRQDQAPVLVRPAAGFTVAVSDTATPVVFNLAPFVSDVDNSTAQLSVVASGGVRSRILGAGNLSITVQALPLTEPLYAQGAVVVSAIDTISFVVSDGHYSVPGVLTLGIACGAGLVPNVWSPGPLCAACPAGAKCETPGAKPRAAVGWASHVEADGTLLFSECVPPEKVRARLRGGAGVDGAPARARAGMRVGVMGRRCPVLWRGLVLHGGRVLGARQDVWRVRGRVLQGALSAAVSWRVHTPRAPRPCVLIRRRTAFTARYDISVCSGDFFLRSRIAASALTHMYGTMVTRVSSHRRRARRPAAWAPSSSPRLVAFYCCVSYAGSSRRGSSSRCCPSLSTSSR